MVVLGYRLNDLQGSISRETNTAAGTSIPGSWMVGYIPQFQETLPSNVINDLFGTSTIWFFHRVRHCCWMVSASSGRLDHIGRLDFSRARGWKSISVSRGTSYLPRALRIILDVANSLRMSAGQCCLELVVRLSLCTVLHQLHICAHGIGFELAEMFVLPLASFLCVEACHLSLHSARGFLSIQLKANDSFLSDNNVLFKEKYDPCTESRKCVTCRGLLDSREVRK